MSFVGVFFCVFVVVGLDVSGVVGFGMVSVFLCWWFSLFLYSGISVTALYLQYVTYLYYWSGFDVFVPLHIFKGRVAVFLDKSRYTVVPRKIELVPKLKNYGTDRLKVPCLRKFYPDSTIVSDQFR